MSLLAGTLYDPAVAVTKVTSAALAMTALDTTNLRLTFTVPANGIVLVRMAGVCTGSTTDVRILLGILEGATIRGRQSPIGGVTISLATDLVGTEACFLVTGLTPGASLTWDAAYGVEVIAASTGIKYGGPNTNAGANAFGGFVFEVYDTIALLAGKMYDPAAAATPDGNTLSALTAFDTTNLRLVFTVPASGRVYWHIRVPRVRGATVWGSHLLGVLEGATVRGRMSPARGAPQTGSTNTAEQSDAGGVVTGLTPGASLTWDAAYATQVVNGTANQTFKYGGPDDTTANNAWGGFAFEVWAV